MAYTNSICYPLVLVETPDSWAFVTTELPLKNGTGILNIAHLPVVTYNHRYFITKGLYEYFDTTNHPTSRMNHSCDPNLIIDPNNWSLVTCRDVEAGEELRFNYLQTEHSIIEPFHCNCGSENCFGYISGFKYLTVEQKSYIKRHYPIPSFFKELC